MIDPATVRIVIENLRNNGFTTAQEKLLAVVLPKQDFSELLTKIDQIRQGTREERAGRDDALYVGGVPAKRREDCRSNRNKILSASFGTSRHRRTVP